MRVFLGAGLPLLLALPLTRYVRGKSALIALPLLICVTLLAASSAMNASSDLWDGPVAVHGDGTSLWTLTHHRDFARAFVVLRESFPGAMLYGRRIRWQSTRAAADAEAALATLSAAGLPARAHIEPLSMEDTFVSVLRSVGLRGG